MIFISFNFNSFIFLFLLGSAYQIATFYLLTFIKLRSRTVTSHAVFQQLLKLIYLLQKMYYYLNHLLFLYIMTQIYDEQALLLLLKSPKKKYIKNLLQYAACLQLFHNYPPTQFTNPTIQSFQSDLQLSKQQSHRLILALSSLVHTANSINFDFQRQSIFSQQFDQKLKQILQQCLLSLQPQYIESSLSSIRIGNKLLDINWKLDLQVTNQKGKINIPIVNIQLETLNNSQLEIQKIQMKGQEFKAFFNNLGKIRDNLLQLVEKGHKN